MRPYFIKSRAGGWIVTAYEDVRSKGVFHRVQVFYSRGHATKTDAQNAFNEWKAAR